MFEQTFKNIDDILHKDAGCTSELDYTEQSSWLLFLKYLDALEVDKAAEAELEGKRYSYILEPAYRWEAWAAPKTLEGKLDHNAAMTGDDLRDFVNGKLFPYLAGFKQRATGPNTIEYKIGEVFGEIKNKLQSGYSLRYAIDLVDELRFRSQTEKHELSHLYEAKIKNMGNAGRNGGEYYTPRPLIRAMIKVLDPKIGERMVTGAEGDVAGYPGPDELWKLTHAEVNAWRDRFAAVPFEDKGGTWQGRYYQDIAIRNALEAIADGRDRILLTLATGTGKTFIAFQLAWKLFQSRWNLADWRSGAEPTRRPRILFLADRNILADQAYNAFSAFEDRSPGTLVRIAPDEIKGRGRVPTNGSVFFTIFQTFMSGPGGSPYFGEYPADFFDFIVIDECHRGGANDEGNWRAILDYFAPAVQLGLTATPKRTLNADTYAYFGEPVFVYSLKEGINDGFLTPFKVKQIATTLDEYVYTPDDLVVEGEIETGKRYEEKDFNKIIEIKEREKYRVKLLMDMIDQRERTIVFCATQAHALAVRDLINQAKTSTDPNYCARVTANDGALGDQALREFQDNDKTIPTVLTTSQKLSTGVDARNVRNIVLMRPINSMIEFKQIIGRGTRLYDGKDYFTIYDFVKAHHHFNDPEWDGEPIEPEPRPPRTGDGATDVPAGEPPPPPLVDPLPARIKVRLADGKERQIQHMTATSFWSADGRPMSAAQFLELLYGALPEFFKDEDELRRLWSAPDTRKKLLAGLADRGFGREPLAEMQKLIDAENSDLFDVLGYVAFAAEPLTRAERAAAAKVATAAEVTDKQQAFVDFVLAQYVRQGVDELDAEKLAPLLKLKYQNTLADAFSELGKPDQVRSVFLGFQRHLYERRVLG